MHFGMLRIVCLYALFTEVSCPQFTLASSTYWYSTYLAGRAFRFSAEVAGLCLLVLLIRWAGERLGLARQVVDAIEFRSKLKRALEHSQLLADALGGGSGRG